MSFLFKSTSNLILSNNNNKMVPWHLHWQRNLLNRIGTNHTSTRSFDQSHTMHNGNDAGVNERMRASKYFNVHLAFSSI